MENADLAALIQRLRDHATIHEGLAAYDDDARQWADDLYIAADALYRFTDSGLLRRALSLAPLRSAAMKLAPLCPACESPQVQLTDWSVEPTEWRCRVCRRDFVVDALGERK